MIAVMQSVFLNGQGYVQDGRSINVSLSINNHHAKFLNNRENQTSFLSYFGRIGHSTSLSRLFNISNQIGIGTLQNAHKDEAFWTKSFTADYSMTVSMNLFKFFKRDYSKALTPYGFTGYQIRYFDEKSSTRANNVLASFLVGAGIAYSLNNNESIFVQSGVAQRLGADFQTTLQNQLGFMLHF
jgi:hypothetical protein